MTITIDTNSRTALKRIKHLNTLTKEGIEYGAYISARGLVKTTSTEILRKPKGGKVYIRRDSLGRRRRHVASAPGETHANMTGKLRRSLGFKVNAKQIEFGYGVVKNDAPYYAANVEFGTRRMAARPSLQNGIKAENRNLQNNFEREIGKRLGDKIT